MTRNEYLERERDMLLKAYATADEKEKRQIMLKIMNIDTQTGEKDTYGKKSSGYFTRRRNKIIYVNQQNPGKPGFLFLGVKNKTNRLQ